MYTVTTGTTAVAADLNQIIGVLQKSSGSTEKGAYWISSDCYANTGQVSISINTLNRVSTPSSVSIDTSLSSPSNMGSGPSTNWLTSSAFQVNGTGNSATLNVNAAGLTTVQF